MSMEGEYPQPARQRKQYMGWDARRIRALREYLKLTQSQMADELQVRQQTISEWETGLHTPHRSMQKVLSMVAEQTGFAYTRNSPDAAGAHTGETREQQAS